MTGSKQSVQFTGVNKENVKKLLSFMFYMWLTAKHTDAVFDNLDRERSPRNEKPISLSLAQFSKIKRLSVAKLSSAFPFSSAAFVFTSSISTMSMNSATI